MKPRSNTIKFIKKAKCIHGNTYDYTEFNYINAKTKGYIICKKHGKFYQTPNTHLRNHGCPKCRSSKGEIKNIQYT